MKDSVSLAVCILILLCIPLVVHADEPTPGVLAKLLTDTTVSGRQESVTSIVIGWPYEQKYLWQLSHQGDKVAYILYPEKVGDLSRVVVLAVVPVLEPINIWDGKQLNNHFAAMDVKWSPLGKTLWVKFGFLDTGYGIWIEFDATTGRVIGDEGELRRLQAIQLDDRPDWMQVPDNQTPVWSLDGTMYVSEHAAKQAGVQKTFDEWVHGNGPQLASTVIIDGDEFLGVMGSGRRAYVLRAEKVIKVITLTAPLYHGLWCLEIDGIVYLKKFVTNPPLLPTDPPSGRQKLVAIRIGKVTVDFVRTLANDDVLLVLDDAERKRVELVQVDMAKLKSLGRKGAGTGQAADAAD